MASDPKRLNLGAHSRSEEKYHSIHGIVVAPGGWCSTGWCCCCCWCHCHVANALGSYEDDQEI